MAKEFILKDVKGNDRIFNKDTIFVPGTDGELLQFTYGKGNPVIHPLGVTESGTYTAPAGVDGYNPVVVDVKTDTPVETTVNLDFSSGDMVVTPKTGEVFSKATIAKPDALISENIAEGVDIAGIIGTLASGGSKMIFSTGIITTSEAGVATVSHGLGRVPDIIFIIYTGNDYSTYPRLRSAAGISSALKKKLGTGFASYIADIASGKNYPAANRDFIIDYTSSFGHIIKNATETDFKVGSSSYPILANTTWIAIGGLT